MAEPLLIPDSPLAKYLQNVVPSEKPIQTTQPKQELDSDSDLGFDLFSWYTNLMSTFINRSDRDLNKSTICNPNESFDDVQARLSETLKYLICSSFLLNPNSQSTFYESLSTSPFSSHQHEQSSQLYKKSTYNHKNSIMLILLIPPFLILLSSLSTWLSSILFTIITSFLFLHPSSPLNHQSETDPLQLQTQLVPTVADLVSNSQAMDARISRAMGAIKEIECVALGLSISQPMPPISRLESASFPFTDPQIDPDSTQTIPSTKLHAIGLRKAVKSVLEQARHLYEQAASDLEIVLQSFSSSSTPDACSPLQTLMEMYGCSREHSNLNQLIDPPLSLSARKARRESWRLSSPNPYESHHNRASWQPALRTSRNDSDINQIGSFEDFKASMNRRSGIQTRRLGLAIGSPIVNNSSSEALYANALGIGSSLNTPGTPQLNWNSNTNNTTGIDSPPTPLSSIVDQTETISPLLRPDRPIIDRRVSLGWGQNPSSKHSNPTSTPRPRPSSNSRPLPTLLPTPSLRRTSSCEPTNSISPSPLTSTSTFDKPEPLSLIELQIAFERMHISRKRTLCGLLALDFSCPLAGHKTWFKTVLVIEKLNEEIKRLTCDLNDGMSQEFGPGTFDLKSNNDKTSLGITRSSSLSSASEEETKIRKDFSPPVNSTFLKQKNKQDIVERLKIVENLLKTLTIKLSFSLKELNENDLNESLKRYESMKIELEKIGKEWDQSRCKLRNLVISGNHHQNQNHQKIIGINNQTKLRPESIDSGESGRTSSIFSSELLTPLEEDNSIEEVEKEVKGEDEEEIEKEFIIKPKLEEVFETYSSSNQAQSVKNESSLVGRIKLTRDERIKLLKEKRESMPIQTKQINHNNHVVTELKDVLSVLKARRLKQFEDFNNSNDPNNNSTEKIQKFRQTLMF
ncbi:hypothetical protein CROQUDRAFT_47684 [Cronartium quercuum f. sp. fusiforme G11]|uniref:Myosin-binding domain-containing protein n=1 Tax=Cronartium quercuum f. sp. fusiforme G11 TaxID=708437 RepID=A0A9P6NDY4_9BASI|nr:hypothetical protein CROQUDRAFT_47684 [Cronartium quercuum f. sp. fusiforme G11]